MAIGGIEQATLQARVEAALTRLRTGAPSNEKNIRVFDAARHQSELVAINVSMLAREANCSRQSLYDRCSYLLPLSGSPDDRARPSPKTTEPQGEESATICTECGQTASSGKVAIIQAELATERATLAKVRSERAQVQRELERKTNQLRYVQAECHVLQQSVIELNKENEDLKTSRKTMIEQTRKSKPALGAGSSTVAQLDRHKP
jgi:hypothetical protein